MLCTVNDVAPWLVEKQGLVDIPVKYVSMVVAAAKYGSDRIADPYRFDRSSRGRGVRWLI